MVLANTEQLHERIEQLCARIRELETGLRTLQASVSSEPHPLLQKPAGVFQPMIPNPGRTSPTTLPSLQTEPTESDEESEEDNFVDAFGARFDMVFFGIVSHLLGLGTLTLGRGGESSFFGKTARTEVGSSSFCALSSPF